MPEWLLSDCTDSAVCFSRLTVLTGQKLRLRFAKPSESHGSAEVYFTGRNELKQPTQNTAAKKTARWESTGSDYLFAKFEYMVRPEI